MGHTRGSPIANAPDERLATKFVSLLRVGGDPRKILLRARPIRRPIIPGSITGRGFTIRGIYVTEKIICSASGFSIPASLTIRFESELQTAQGRPGNLLPMGKKWNNRRCFDTRIAGIIKPDTRKADNIKRRLTRNRCEPM